jgi:iron complex transport system substrate-binding protein
MTRRTPAPSGRSVPRWLAGRRTPRLSVAAVAALAAVTLATGCADDPAGDSGASGAPSGAAATYPVTVGKLTLDSRPEKIVALSPTTTEVLFAIGAGAQVTAVDDNSDYPPEAPKSDLSGFQPNAEAIAAKNPDLVVISNDLNKIVDQLGQLKIPVYLAPAAVTLDDTYRQIGDLGALTGHPAEATALVERMRSDVAEIVKSVPQRPAKPTYYYELGVELYSATSKTFIGSLFAMAGLDNIADPADADGAKGGYPQLSEEFIVKADPDFVFLADTKCCGQSPATVKARPGWSGITAVTKDQIVSLDDDIASRWGPRVIDLLRTIVASTAKATG